MGRKSKKHNTQLNSMIYTRKIIEEHQKKIREKLTFSKKAFWNLEERLIEERELDKKELKENTPNNTTKYVFIEKDITSEHTSLLWVYEPSDLEEMSIEEIIEIWENREELCGSKESAAEALAIYEVAKGISPEYRGWITYIGREEIIQLDAPFLPKESAESYKHTTDTLALSKEQVIGLNYEDLKLAWSNRPDSFSSIEAACQALLLLRQQANLVENDTWHSLMHHPEIEKLLSFLPNEIIETKPKPHDNSGETKDSIYLDTRNRVLKSQVVREGQQNFRASVMANYYNTCCITNCRIKEILEAAHIVPYSGPSSNRLDNSLCLRVDVHRLFDKFLISIDPEDYTVNVSESLKNDPIYRNLDGLKVNNGKIHASKKLIAQHFILFKKCHDNANQHT